MFEHHVCEPVSTAMPQSERERVQTELARGAVAPAAHLSDRRVEAVLSERQEITGTLVRKRFLTAMPSVKRDYTYHRPRFAVSGTVYDHALRVFDPEATVPERDGPYAREEFDFSYPNDVIAPPSETAGDVSRRLFFGPVKKPWR